MALAREDVRTRISANGLPFPYKEGVSSSSLLAPTADVRRRGQFAASAGASIAGQVFITTSRPTAWARSAAAWSITPS